MSTSRYPVVIFFRHDKYSEIDNFIESNKESLMCSVHITNDISELNKLYNHNYHVLVTYGDTYAEYDYISSNIPSRFSSRWFHKNNMPSINEFNHNVNYCYITNVIENREKTRPIFSIFTTCFKSYDYINTAYESIKKQTLKDWEWVIMDDTPEDEHFTFLRDTLSRDNRIRLYKRDKNSGNIGNVKNEVISLCRGKYVLEMDHDDEILKDCLLDSYNIFQSDPEIGFVYGDTINLFRDRQNCKYPDNILCKGYGGYYSEFIDGQWRFIYNTPNINNITLSYLICLPNHPRIWNRAVLMELESYSEYLPICDDYEILLRTCCSKYKVVKNNKAQYIQYMNNDGNNFSNIRNAEINRIGPKYISPMFYAKYGVQDKMKELDAYENPDYIRNVSDIWKRGPEYQHKIMNSRINLDYNKQYCIINDAIDNDRLKELYQNSKNDFLVLSNKITTQELWVKLNSLGFGRMKCYSYKGCSDEELIKYFKMMYKNDNCDYEIIQNNNTEIISTNPRVFIIHNNNKGGVEKYINDIITLYDNYEYLFIKNKEMLYKNDYSNKDILFIQNLLNCDIKITDIINVRNKYKFNLFISIHDFIWLCKDQHQYTYDIPSAYLSNNIIVSEDVTNLLLLADKVIMNSKFTYDIYSKYFDSSNFTVCYPSDYNIQFGIKNIPEIQNKCMNIGVFSPLCKFKGERYVNYLKSKYECDTIQFQIVGQNIPYYKEVEFYDFIRKYNINGFLLLNEWGETYGYLLTKIINSGLPLLYNNFGAVKERLYGTQENMEHYFKVYDNEHNDDVTIDYTILESQFNKYIEYINTNNGKTQEMNEDLTIRSRPVYDELFLPITNVYQNREIPKHVFQTSKDILPPYVKELINIYCPDWKYSHFTDKECIQFFIDNPIAEFPNIIQKFNSFTQGQHKADIFRYYYLYLRGGVFLDSDAMFETNIDNIIQNYDSVFAKSHMKNEHLFNGFIATYPRNEIIYDALKHAYYTENHILQTNYHYLCEELLRIANTEQKKASRQNMVIYQEYSDTIDDKGIGRFKNTNEETVFIHYWQDRKLPSKLVNSLISTRVKPQNKKIGIFNSFPFHYEMFGFILNYAKNNDYEVDIYTNTQNNLGWIDFYCNNFNNFNIIDFNHFNGNTINYDKVFVITDYDHTFKTEWMNKNVICINHTSKIKKPEYKHYLNVAQFKDSTFDYINPCYNLNIFQNKTHNNTVNIIGGGYGLNFSIVNRLHSNNKIKLNIFVRNTEQINIENMSILDKNKFDINFKIAIDATEMINELNKSSYILINYNSSQELNTGRSCSGSLQLALSTLCKPIMAKTANKYLKIENALEFDIDSDEPINIDDEIDFKAIEQERNKYVDKFESYMNILKIRTYLNLNLNLNKHAFSMNDFANVINEFNLNLNNIFEIRSMNGFDANVLSQICKVRDVHVFEAVPNYCKNIEKQYPSFKVNTCAINNYNGTAKFNIIKDNNNYGLSSLRNRNKDIVKDEEEYNTVVVNSIRMDKYIEDNNIKSIDICKIVVDGCSYEILEGFGKYLNYIKFLHIESESIQYWENQKLTEDIFNLLENNFIRLSNSYNSNEKQIDSIFVNKEIINTIKVNNDVSKENLCLLTYGELRTFKNNFRNNLSEFLPILQNYKNTYIFILLDEKNYVRDKHYEYIENICKEFNIKIGFIETMETLNYSKKYVEEEINYYNKLILQKKNNKHFPRSLRTEDGINSNLLPNDYLLRFYYRKYKLIELVEQYCFVNKLDISDILYARVFDCIIKQNIPSNDIYLNIKNTNLENHIYFSPDTTFIGNHKLIKKVIKYDKIYNCDELWNNIGFRNFSYKFDSILTNNKDTYTPEIQYTANIYFQSINAYNLRYYRPDPNCLDKNLMYEIILDPNRHNTIKLDSNNIPKKLFQSWETTNIEPEFQKIIDKWKEFNPDYEYIFHNSEQRLKFIEENFEENVVNAYNKIIPGAYKCDLWRYCVLYIHGGFYADIDTLCMGKLNDLTSDNIDFIVPIDLNINPIEGGHNLACGFFGSVPKSSILLDAINRIVFNVENNNIPKSKLDFSGPGVLGRAVNKFLKLEETSSFKGKEGIKNNINFLHFDSNTEYISDISTNKKILQNKNKNSDIIRLYNNECNKINGFKSWNWTSVSPI